LLTEAFSKESDMCRKREIYTTSPDTYCSVIKQYFNEKGIDYREVDIGKNEAGFNELIRLYGKGPLPVIVEDGRIVPITQVMQNAHVMFQGYAGNIE
jgi:glutaredoxin